MWGYQTRAPFIFGIFLLAGLLLPAAGTPAATSADVQARLDADLVEGKPAVVHLVVALCDNENQGIVPVPKALGNGQDPASNLYWGALYGVKTHLKRSGWQQISTKPPEDAAILERIVLQTRIRRNGAEIPVYLVADAWDGAHIRSALTTYLRMAAGDNEMVIDLGDDTPMGKLRAGGSAQMIAFVGHNGLMDFSLPAPTAKAGATGARSALILACASKSYFEPHLQSAGAHPLLLTTGLMAPEAYTLDAAIRAWATDGATAKVTEAAARAYHKYQKCGMNGARRLFWGSE